jgi:LmbE family N-acetylglucosaminyl deacetylase
MDILNIISKYNIDTLITVWQHDAHTDHRVASKIALAASREIPRVLLTRVSWNSVPFAYKPNYFVDITSQFQSKLDTLKCYKDEFERTGDLWEKFISSQGKLYGLESGCDLAEGFEIVKWLE